MLDVRNVLRAQGLLEGNELLANLVAQRRRTVANGMPEREWYRIENATADVAEMWIYDEISWWGVSADNFARDLRAVTAPSLVVRINSPGGDVFDGVAIMNALRSHPAHVTTRVDSLAASIASVIAQGGDRRVMVQHSQMMIHEASGFMYGNADEMRAFGELLDKVSDNIAGVYAARAGTDDDAEAFRAFMRDETWLSDTEAVALGLADEVEVPATADPPAPANATGTAAATTVAPDDSGRIRAKWLEVIPKASTAAHEELLV